MAFMQQNCTVHFPDISIIALMNGNYNDDFYDEFGKLCRFKYNIDASAYFVSRYVSLSALCIGETFVCIFK